MPKTHANAQEISARWVDVKPGEVEEIAQRRGFIDGQSSHVHEGYYTKEACTLIESELIARGYKWKTKKQLLEDELALFYESAAEGYSHREHSDRVIRALEAYVSELIDKNMTLLH